MTAAPSRRATAIVFALLVVATGGAFVATQRLKRSAPIVERVFFYQYLSPNGDGRKDTVTLRFDLPKSQRVTVSVVDNTGEEVKTLADDVFLSKGTHPFRWDGRDDDGNVVPDGRYRLRVGLREEGRSITAPRILHVDTRPPHPRIIAATPPTLVPGTAGPRGRVRVRFVGPTRQPPAIGVWRTDSGKAQQVDGFQSRRGRETFTWDGMVNDKPAPEGSYAFSITVEDQAGNRGSVPRRLPPTRRGAVKRGGVAVSYFTLSGPLVPVKPGAIARFAFGPVPRPVRWRLAPYGRGGVIKSGISHGRKLSVRIPSNADSDIYSLFATSNGRHAAWPLVVSNKAGSAPVLVVLPAMTWQGQNPVDSNRDGWPDTLDDGDDVPLQRSFFRGRPPKSIVDDSVNTLEFLNQRIRANYDLTTDVALAAGKTPAIPGHNGVLLAGREAWLTPKLELQLRRFVQGGGTVASFGTDALRRRTELSKGKLIDPTPRARTDIFGERAGLFATPEAPLVVSQDKLGLFQGSDSFIGNFRRFERSEGLDPKASLLTAAGRYDPAGATKPDFVAYTLGEGLVIRVGTDGWPASLASSPETANATRRMWTLLSR